MENFNFDEWAALYKNSPEEFERKRKQVLEAEILKAPVAQRNTLRVLQMECDVYHETMTPLAATVQISKSMIEQANRLKELHATLNKQVEELEDIAKKLP